MLVGGEGPAQLGRDCQMLLRHQMRDGVDGYLTENGRHHCRE